VIVASFGNRFGLVSSKSATVNIINIRYNVIVAPMISPILMMVIALSFPLPSANVLFVVLSILDSYLILFVYDVCRIVFVDIFE